jgi:hypothetical protein
MRRDLASREKPFTRFSPGNMRDNAKSMSEIIDLHLPITSA